MGQNRRISNKEPQKLEGREDLPDGNSLFDSPFEILLRICPDTNVPVIVDIHVYDVGPATDWTVLDVCLVRSGGEV